MGRKVVIAVDKFRPKFSSSQVCDILSSEISKKHKTLCIPLADGGEGSLEILDKISKINTDMRIETRSVSVLDPLLRKIEAHYKIDLSTRRAYIEMSMASGLNLLANTERNPLLTSTLGTGQLLSHALAQGCREVVVFVGGSATNEGGIGAAKALGYHFQDQKQREIEPIAKNLCLLHNIVPPSHKPWENTTIYVATDVGNPLLGPEGATFCYGRQKGANDLDLILLEKGMTHLCEKYKQFFNKDVSNMKGAGAAGGLAAGLVVFVNAQIISGIEFLMQLTNLEKEIQNSDIVVTGEGKVDNQTLHGKTVNGVVKLAQKYNKPVVIFCGKAEIPASEFGKGVTILENEKNGMGKDFAIEHAEELLRESAKKYFLI